MLNKKFILKAYNKKYLLLDPQVYYNLFSSVLANACFDLNICNVLSAPPDIMYLEFDQSQHNTCLSCPDKLNNGAFGLKNNTIDTRYATINTIIYFIITFSYPTI